MEHRSVTVDAAIRAIVLHHGMDKPPILQQFIPFDLTKRLSEATVIDDAGTPVRVVQGRIRHGHRPVRAVCASIGGREGSRS